jgi:hypothetical protein
VSAGAAFWSSSTSLATVIGWRIAADAGAGGVFSLDPLWPGLLVSIAVLAVMHVAGPKRIAEAAA